MFITDWSCRIFLAFQFAFHGFRAFMLDERFFYMFENLGIESVMMVVLLRIIGILDIFVAFMMLVRLRKPVVVWAALWPLVPAVASIMAGYPSLLHKIGIAVPPLVAGMYLYFRHSLFSKQYS